MDRRRKKKRKKKKTSMPPSDVTPTIHEVDEEEAESEMEGQCQAATPTEPSEELPQVTSTYFCRLKYVHTFLVLMYLDDLLLLVYQTMQCT
ncbi:hypothetical protein PO909_033035 [Leuciscus waleckii]